MTLVAALLQLLLAATFLVVPAVGARHGRAAQRAATAEVRRQGVAATVLTEHRIDFGASPGSVVLAMAIGVWFAVLAVLNLTSSDIARPLSWISAGIILLLGLLIMPGEVFTIRYLTAALRKSATTGLDVPALVGAARRAYPRWFGTVVAARFVLATVGSVAVAGLLLAGG